MTPIEQAMARLEQHFSVNADIRIVLAELTRLRAALPKTADGVTVVPGMELWEKMAVGNPPLRLKDTGTGKESSDGL